VSLYHLGSARGNLLRPFEHCLTGRVLEIGAGCGAISRYLGECGATVLSLEGSRRRARIAASRTRDLDKVTVIAERFEQFQPLQRFDVITLIGVLEYASLFNQGDDPALDMLVRVRELLEPDGILLLAIENQ
ncbi:class I SAM-dependent methyltransferase, partial [Pseudomonas viridiflava]|uniref:class I SAM-dependent methyltransferase n=1 Tax=Pseudomonas viridiflava TaxID=33069 RepID=UPI0013DA6BA5